MPELLPALAAFAGTTAGAATIAGVASAGVGAGLSKILAPSTPHFAIPPPPGATLIDPAGQEAASDQRRRAAAAGGLQSTISAAGGSPGPTAGGKTLLGS